VSVDHVPTSRVFGGGRQLRLGLCATYPWRPVTFAYPDFHLSLIMSVTDTLTNDAARTASTGLSTTKPARLGRILQIAFYVVWALTAVYVLAMGQGLLDALLCSINGAFRGGVVVGVWVHRKATTDDGATAEGGGLYTTSRRR
jgi:hypothetical protein